jgi:hypothetical protein
MMVLALMVMGAGIGLTATVTDTSVVSATVAGVNSITVDVDPVFGSLSPSSLHQQAGTPLTLTFKSNASSVTVNMYTDNGAVAQQGMIHETDNTKSLLLKYYMDWSGSGIVDPNTGTNWTDAWIFVYDASASGMVESWKQLYSGGPIVKTVQIGLATDVSETDLVGTYSTTLTFDLIYV